MARSVFAQRDMPIWHEAGQNHMSLKLVPVAMLFRASDVRGPEQTDKHQIGDASGMTLGVGISQSNGSRQG